MANSNSHLNLLSTQQPNKELTANAKFNAASPAMLFARDEVESDGLTWGYVGGYCPDALGIPVFRANGELILTPSATNYVYHVFGVVAFVTAAPAGWPGQMGGGKVALHEVPCGTDAPTGWTDFRTWAPMVGRRIGTPAWADPMTLDFDKYDVIRVTLTNSTTFAMQGGLDGCRYDAELTQPVAGGKTGSWGAEAKFSVDTPTPVLTVGANKMDRFTWIKVGANYHLDRINKGF